MSVLRALGRSLVLYPLQGLWHSVRTVLGPLMMCLYPLWRLVALPWDEIKPEGSPNTAMRRAVEVEVSWREAMRAEREYVPIRVKPQPAVIYR